VQSSATEGSVESFLVPSFSLLCHAWGSQGRPLFKGESSVLWCPRMLCANALASQSADVESHFCPFILIVMILIFGCCCCC
jgi:hypothetical protein